MAQAESPHGTPPFAIAQVIAHTARGRYPWFPKVLRRHLFTSTACRSRYAAELKKPCRPQPGEEGFPGQEACRDSDHNDFPRQSTRLWTGSAFRVHMLIHSGGIWLIDSARDPLYRQERFIWIPLRMGRTRSTEHPMSTWRGHRNCPQWVGGEWSTMQRLRGRELTQPLHPRLSGHPDTIVADTVGAELSDPPTTTPVRGNRAIRNDVEVSP